ncbi:hypothetical protein [Lysobacter silvisoli]|nr:hypothetical protein [Lysobacter silvisoli]
MKRTAGVGCLVLLASMPAWGVCIVEPLEPQLRAADTVYVGTVIRSQLTSNLETLGALKDPRKRSAEIEHTLVPQIVLKGEPSQAPSVVSSWRYNDPRAATVVEFSEQATLTPGDTVLVIARSGEQTRYSLCSATRKWDRDAIKATRAVFRLKP